MRKHLEYRSHKRGRTGDTEIALSLLRKHLKHRGALLLSSALSAHFRQRRGRLSTHFSCSFLHYVIDFKQMSCKHAAILGLIYSETILSCNYKSLEFLDRWRTNGYNTLD